MKYQVKKTKVMFSSRIDPDIVKEFRRVCNKRRIKVRDALEVKMAEFIASMK